MSLRASGSERGNLLEPPTDRLGWEVAAARQCLAPICSFVLHIFTAHQKVHLECPSLPSLSVFSLAMVPIYSEIPANCLHFTRFRHQIGLPHRSRQRTIRFVFVFYFANPASPPPRAEYCPVSEFISVAGSSPTTDRYICPTDDRQPPTDRLPPLRPVAKISRWTYSHITGRVAPLSMTPADLLNR